MPSGSDPGGLRGLLEDLETRIDQQSTELFDRIAEGRDAGRGDLTESENRGFADLKALTERRDEIAAEIDRAGDTSELTRRITGDTEPRNTNMTNRHADDRDLQYRRGNSTWFRDLTRVSLNMDDTGEARRRLSTHAQQVAQHPAFQETRDLSTTPGDAGYFAPPAHLIDQYVALARPGRAFANLLQSQPLPGGVSSLQIPKIVTGTAVGPQVADNATIEDVDLTDSVIDAPVQTIAGQQGYAIQLLEQSPIDMDTVIMGDLMAAHAASLDQQVIYGTGTSGQITGVSLTAGIQTIAVASNTVEGVYSAVANAIQSIHTTRFLPPDVICMHPRRWGWCLGQLDSEGRPLFVPLANGPMNAQGLLESVASQQVVGQMLGLPIVTDPGLSTTLGSGSGGGTQDAIYVMRSSDIVLWESGIRARSLPQPKAQNLTVLCQLWSYLALAVRYPQSVVEITGLTAPSW